MSGNVKFRWFLLAPIVLSFLVACASTGTLENTSSGTLNNTSPTLQINTSDVATGTGFLFSSSDYVITSYHVVHGAKSIRVRLKMEIELMPPLLSKIPITTLPS